MSSQTSPVSTIDRTQITGVVLAGGLGRRMGGVDKGLQLLDGQALVGHVIARLQPQVGALLINANRNVERYAEFGYPVISDQLDGFAGPLAGLHAALSAATTPYVATTPCDSPFLPVDLVFRLFLALTAEDAQIAIARTGDRAHPVFCLCRRMVLPDLTDYLQRGERRFAGWTARLPMVEVAFDDQPEAFANINTGEELQGLNERLA